MADNFFGKIMEKLKGKTGPILVLGLLGILLIYFSGFFSTESTEPVKKDTFSLDVYIESTELKIQNIVSSITGEKSPQVMVTAKSALRQVYAVENNTSEKNDAENTQSESEEKYVIIKNSKGEQQPVTVTEIQPEIKGVVVVSKYGSDFYVKEQIINAVRTALDLPTSKVCVVSSINLKQTE